MADQSKPENFFELSAWVLFLVIGVLEILFGIGDMIAGSFSTRRYSSALLEEHQLN